MTRFVATAHLEMAQRNKDAWVAESWVDGQADQRKLDAYRARADAYRAFLEADFADYQTTVEHHGKRRD